MKTFRTFMTETEELVELSKKTLGRYISKAADNMAGQHSKAAEVDNAREQLQRAKSRAEHQIPRGRLPSNMVGRYGDANKSDDDVLRVKQREHEDKVYKRFRGIQQAVNKLTKEDTEINELSKKTLGRYIVKSNEKENDRGRAEVERKIAAKRVSQELAQGEHDTWKTGSDEARTAMQTARYKLDNANDKREFDDRKKTWKRQVGMNRAVNKLTGQAKVNAKD